MEPSQRLAGGCAQTTTDHAELHTALLANDDAALRLPSYSTFEPLMPQATAVQMADTGTFASHTTYELPCSPNGPCTDSVHRFTLNRAVSGPLNSSLGAWCERKAEAATEYERLVQASLPPELADMALRVRRAGSAAGVQLSNQGGFQSYHDLFTEQVGKKRKHSYRHCRKVRLLAIDQSPLLPSPWRAQPDNSPTMRVFPLPGSFMHCSVPPWIKSSAKYHEGPVAMKAARRMNSTRRSRGVTSTRMRTPTPSTCTTGNGGARSTL